MKTENRLALAIKIVSRAFNGKFDKGGSPYVLHCFRVMDGVDGDECVKCAALMHDLIEDTDYTITILAGLGFSDKTLNLVRLMTHREGVGYMDYIESISKNGDATKIKLSDLRDNMNLKRLTDIGPADLTRLQKYKSAHKYLSNYE